MKNKSVLFRAVLVLLTVTAAGMVSGCSGKSEGLKGVKSIVFEQQAIEIEGHKETVTVMPDGLIERRLASGGNTETEKSAVNPGDFEKLVEILNKNRFTELPDDVSTDSKDGAILTITVETETVTYQKSGLNPDNQDFLNCYHDGLDLLQ